MLGRRETSSASTASNFKLSEVVFTRTEGLENTPPKVGGLKASQKDQDWCSPSQMNCVQ